MAAVETVKPASIVAASEDVEMSKAGTGEPLGTVANGGDSHTGSGELDGERAKALKQSRLTLLELFERPCLIPCNSRVLLCRLKSPL